MSELNDGWIASTILDAVYISDADTTEEIPSFRDLPRKVVERSVPVAPSLAPPSRTLPIAEQVLAVMLSRRVRRGKRSLVEPFVDQLRSSIEQLVGHEQPISFVLPTLPFKDQSPFVTQAAIDHVDLGEYALFAQLKRIVEAIKRIYNPGAHFTLLCDGYIYADIFASGDVDGAGRYKAQCERIKNELGLHNEVTLFDMREVLFDVPEWRTVLEAVRGRVHALTERDDDVRRRIDTLARRFTYHVQLEGISYDEARAVYAQDTLPDWVSEQLYTAALGYAALHVTLKYTRVVERAFPSAIRCTVHPKAAAQFPLHLTNERNALLPYNGVATISRSAVARGRSHFDALRIMRFCDVLHHDDAVAVRTPESEDPFYYELS